MKEVYRNRETCTALGLNLGTVENFDFPISNNTETGGFFVGKRLVIHNFSGIQAHFNHVIIEMIERLKIEGSQS